LNKAKRRAANFANMILSKLAQLNHLRIFLTKIFFFEKKPFPTKRDTMRFVGERIGVDELPVNDDWKAIINYM